jgi:hypothetical protein
LISSSFTKLTVYNSTYTENPPSQMQSFQLTPATQTNKQNAIKFLKHRNKTYLTTPENKQQEETVIKHILHANQYNTSTANRNTNNHYCTHEPEKPKMWAKFTFVGCKVRPVTNLFKSTNEGIAFNTIHNTERLLSPVQHHQQSDKYSKSGVFVLTCNHCQTGYSLYTQYKEHMQDCNLSYRKSQFAKHLLELNQPPGNTAANHVHPAYH